MNTLARSASIKIPIWRSRVLLLLLLTGFLILIARAFYLQNLNTGFLLEKGAARYSRVIEINAHRGMITDRHGEPLAISAPVESVWASPSDVKASSVQLRALAKILNMNQAELQRRLQPGAREFVYLKRHLAPQTATLITQLNIPGIFLKREYRRFYPATDGTSHLLGFTGVDDNGQEGLELAYQEWLAGKPGSRRVIKNRVGQIIEDIENIKVPEPGRDLVLSIDRRIQYLAFRELSIAVAQHKAKAGSIVVLDAKSGEVLALANLPSFNPNKREKVVAARLRNRAITDLFEPGSTLKPFTVAAAMEAGLYKPNSMIQTAPGYLSVGAATIHDAHPQGMLSVAQVIQKSSNVGAAKIALELPRKTLWQVYKNLGYGQPPQTGFPGEAAGRVRPYTSWRPIEQATMAFGHGISVSLLQLARSYMVFANDGEIKPISLLKINDAPAGERVFSPYVAQQIRAMLELVVQPGGTALQAQIPGYRVAGKTGTAHKLAGRTYAVKSYISSFVGMAPASDPRYIVAVMIDDPSGGQYYGGAVAAPAFANVMGGVLRIQNVPADAAPADNAVVRWHQPAKEG